MMKINGSQIVLEVLLEQKVDTIFGYPGGTILNVYDALYKNSDRLRHVMTAHEQGAAHAADGYARATGKTGVVFATSGPGSTNLVTGIATAYMDSTPMVAITANVPTALIGSDSFQEAYITGITMPITKHNYVVRRVEDLADTLRDAFRIANSGRKGPVLVDIPKDVTAAECEYTPKPPVVPTNGVKKPDPTTLGEMAKAINAASRPMVHFGGGVTTSGAADVLREFLAKTGIPACHTIMGVGVLSHDEPYNMGLLGMHGTVSAGLAVDGCDLLVVVGARFSDRVVTNKGDFASRARVVRIDLDPAEMNKCFMSDLNLVADVAEALKALTALCESGNGRLADWHRQLDAWKAADVKPPVSQDKLRPYQVITTLSNALGGEGIIATDVGQHQMWAAQYAKRARPRSFLTSAGLGTMGFGMGAAIGAQVAFPDRRVVLVTGDGSFHMNLNELCTAVSYDLPIVVVVMNNGVLGMVRQWQTLFYGERYASTDPERKTNFVKLAEAFGASGYRATTPAEFESSMTHALASMRPCVIDCIIDKDEMVMPMIPGGLTVKQALTDLNNG
jgi:acetolactate synthase-1/2/3 large subunit